MMFIRDAISHSYFCTDSDNPFLVYLSTMTVNFWIPFATAYLYESKFSTMVSIVIVHNNLMMI